MALATEHERRVAFYHRAVALRDAISEGNETTINREQGELVLNHAVRQLHEIEGVIAGIPTTSLRGFGIKARVLADMNAHLWDRADTLDYQDECTRALLEQLMAAAGVTRIKRPDFTEEDLMAAARADSAKSKAEPKHVRKQKP